jgi:drug/metabolite transporter (DMT)-like permease
MRTAPFQKLAIYRRPSGSERLPSITARDALALTALGFVGYYLSSFLDMIGLQYIAAGVGRLIPFMYPTIVVVISAVVLGKSITRRELIALAITYAGVALVLSGQLDKASENFWLGALLVMLSAVTFSLYLVGSGEVVLRLGSIRFTAYATAAASVFCIAQFMALRALVLPGACHAFKGIGPGTSRVLVMLPPARSEGFFRDVAKEALSPQDGMDRVNEIAAKYSLEFVGPPLD